ARRQLREQERRLRQAARLHAHRRGVVICAQRVVDAQRARAYRGIETNALARGERLARGREWNRAQRQRVAAGEQRVAQQRFASVRERRRAGVETQTLEEWQRVEQELRALRREGKRRQLVRDGQRLGRRSRRATTERAGGRDCRGCRRRRRALHRR